VFQTKHYQDKTFINRAIRAPQVRVVDENGRQLGVMAIEDALRMAAEKGLDLIQVTHKVDPPVCKVGDQGKFLYWEKKKKRLSKPQRGGEIKSIRLGLGISPHDLKTRANQAHGFLNKGHIVLVDMRLRGREKAMDDFAKGKMKQFLEEVGQLTPYKVEREIRKESKGLSMIISANKLTQNEQKNNAR